LVNYILASSLYITGLKKNSIGCIYYANLLVVIRIFTNLYIFEETKGSKKFGAWIYKYSEYGIGGSVLLIVFVISFEMDLARLLAFLAVLCFGAVGKQVVIL
jgi:hypothetical protein